jgi:hypothetical protein
MKSKSDQIRGAWGAGDRVGALRIAARFFDRSSDTKTFKRGIDAYNNPSFYRQLGKDPEQIVRDALDVLAKRFNLYLKLAEPAGKRPTHTTSMKRRDGHRSHER